MYIVPELAKNTDFKCSYKNVIMLHEVLDVN